MIDPRLDKLAHLLVNYCVAVKPEDWVVIHAQLPALPLVDAVLRYTLEAGGRPTLNLKSDQLEETHLRHASAEQLAWVSPFERLPNEEADVLIYIRAADNTRQLSGVDPEQQRAFAGARQEIFNTRMQRGSSGDVRWTITNYPCEAYAQEADMSLNEYEDFVFGATFVDQDDPVAAWLEIAAMQAKLVDYLKGKKLVELRGPNIELQLSIEGRSFVNSDGKRNMPSGEIFTGPVEDSAQGWVQFSYPAIREGREVEGIRLEFKDGQVVEASATKNEDYLHKMQETDAGARRLGELGIGTNYGIQRFTKSMLYDEKIGGTIHLALGRSYPETGGANDSAIHWDMLCDMHTDSEILVDGELFYKDGQFTIL